MFDLRIFYSPPTYDNRLLFLEICPQYRNSEPMEIRKSSINSKRRMGTAWLACENEIDACWFIMILKQVGYFNPLQPRVAFLYPLKTSENLKVF